MTDMGNFMVWLERVIVMSLLGLNVFWLKRYINRQDRKEAAYEEEGGLVTRNLHFAWCKEAHDQCPVVVGWNRLLIDGGPLTGKGPVILNIIQKIDEAFAYNRELVVKDIALMMKEVQIDRTTIESIKTTVDKNEVNLTKLKDSFETVQNNQQRVLERVGIKA